jgi:hypothetical protein
MLVHVQQTFASVSEMELRQRDDTSELFLGPSVSSFYVN